VIAGRRPLFHFFYTIDGQETEHVKRLKTRALGTTKSNTVMYSEAIRSRHSLASCFVPSNASVPSEKNASKIVVSRPPRTLDESAHKNHRYIPSSQNIYTRNYGMKKEGEKKNRNKNQCQRFLFPRPPAGVVARGGPIAPAQPIAIIGHNIFRGILKRRGEGRGAVVLVLYSSCC
jgi:hypothetical protein